MQSCPQPKRSASARRNPPRAKRPASTGMMCSAHSAPAKLPTPPHSPRYHSASIPSGVIRTTHTRRTARPLRHAHSTPTVRWSTESRTVSDQKVQTRYEAQRQDGEWGRLVTKTVTVTVTETVVVSELAPGTEAVALGRGGVSAGQNAPARAPAAAPPAESVPIKVEDDAGEGTGQVETQWRDPVDGREHRGFHLGHHCSARPVPL